MPVKKVFISSTYQDLCDFRAAVRAAVDELAGLCTVGMEDFDARHWDTDAFCRRQVAACELLVGILGNYYGTLHEPSGKSLTEREFDTALRAGKPCLMFIAPEAFRAGPEFHEDDDKQARQRAFRDKVKAHCRPAVFDTPDHLARQVTEVIRKWSSAPVTPAS